MLHYEDKIQLESIRAAILEERDLGKALSLMRLLSGQHAIREMEELEKIGNDYQLMKDFMLRGYVDNERERLYDSLLSRLMQVSWLLQLEILKVTNKTFANASSVAWREFKGVEVLRSQLEDYVQEYALTSLGTDSGQSLTSSGASQLAALNQLHQRSLDVAFSAIISSSPWSQAEGDKWCQMLLSPTIDASDVALLVSAIMLSAMTIADPVKLITLISIYRNAENETVRQRALVGIAFSLKIYEISPCRQVEEAMSSLLADEHAASELIQLQKQVLFCISTDDDTEIIQHEIMPELMKHAPRHFDISDVDDPITPDLDDDAIEQMEKNMARMARMQQRGADIYYAGFSRMKRLPFFYTLSNWFMPFADNHPALQPLSGDKERGLLRILHSLAPFCDSDKYSFALSLPSVISHLPDDMLEGISAELTQLPHDEYASAAYQRRFYLQNLYRFFQLSDFKDSLPNPFCNSSPNCIFVNSTLLGNDDEGRKNVGGKQQSPCGAEGKDDNGNKEKGGKTNANNHSSLIHEPSSVASIPVVEIELKRCFLTTVRHLYARRKYEMLEKVLENTRNKLIKRREDQWSSREANGNSEEYSGILPTLSLLYRDALNDTPESEELLSGYGKTLMTLEDYAEAETVYKKLLTICPDNTRYQLLHAACQLENGKAAEALPTLYRLNYNDPGDANVIRALGWALLTTGQAAKAEHILSQSSHFGENEGLRGNTSSLEEVDGGLLPLGYALWAQNRIAEAVDIFGKCKEKDTLPETFLKDAPLLEQYAITPVDMKIMADMVSSRKNERESQ